MHRQQDVLQEILGALPVAAQQVGEPQQFQPVAVGKFGDRSHSAARDIEITSCATRSRAASVAPFGD